MSNRNEHWIFHPDETFIRNATWLAAQPAGTASTIFEEKNDTYHGTPQLAIGEGRNGKNAIALLSTGQTITGMGGFWLMPKISLGGSVDDPASEASLVIPPTKRVNRLEVWFRFPPGFRAVSAANPTMNQNMHWGTYSGRPAGTNGNLVIGKEMGPIDGVFDDGWHWYHEPTIRHDLVDDNEWIRVVFHGAPHHRRGDNGLDMKPMNPNHQHGDYFSCLTRSYLDFNPAWWWFNGEPPQSLGGDPEVSVPFTIYCDTIRFFWHDEVHPVEIRFGASGDWFEGQEYEVAASPTTTDIPFRVTNVTNSSVTGRLAWKGSFYYAPSIVPQAGGAGFNWQSITLSAGETKHYWLRVSPESFLNSAYPQHVGIVFEPSTEFVGVGPTNNDPTWGQNRVSKWSNRVHCHAINGVGGHDYDICYRSITMLVNGGSNSSYKPTSVGGAKYRVPPTVTSQFQLPGHRPGGGAMAFTKGTSQSGRGTLTISSSGLVNYTPPSAGWTGTCHFSYRINDGDAKQSIWYGAWVDVSALPRVPRTAGGKVMLGPGGGLILTD